MSARLAALGLTGLGIGPSRSFFVRDVKAAAPVSDYKALVCIYMFGGNDSNNLIVPVDTARYTAYQSLRSNLALPPSRLIGPIPDAQNNPYALHSAMPELLQLYGTGHLAFVLNCGGLKRPLTRQQYQQGGANPPNLFSHSDQTTQTQAGAADAVTSGWGGRLLDLFNATDSLAAVSLTSQALFLQGIDVRGNVIPPGASLGLSGVNFWPPEAANARRQAVNSMVLMDGGNPVREAANSALADGLQLADTIVASGNLPPLPAPFPNTSLGNQLKEVARLMRVRSSSGRDARSSSVRSAASTRTRRRMAPTRRCCSNCRRRCWRSRLRVTSSASRRTSRCSRSPSSGARCSPTAAAAITRGAATRW